MPNRRTVTQRKYDEANCKHLSLKLNLRTDSDIINKLSSVPSMQGYIKDLIRADLACNSAPDPVPNLGDIQVFINDLLMFAEEEDKTPMTLEDASINIQEWRKDGVDLPDGLTPELLMKLWNKSI